MLNLEIAKIDDKLAKVFNIFEEGSSCPSDYRASIWLQSDISAILTRSDNLYETVEKIKNIINESTYRNEINNRIDYNKAIKEAEIKQDFETALNNVENGSDLSSGIGWGLSGLDLHNLAKIYKKSDYELKSKIEDLLTDCNFHKECSDFMEGKLEEYIKEVC